MDQRIIVHQRVHERHPEIEDSDVIAAWSNCIRSAQRAGSAFSDTVAVGFDGKGRLIEMIAVLRPDGFWLVYHAFTPPTQRVLKELGLAIKRRKDEQ
jgi:hypothetical protein